MKENGPGGEENLKVKEEDVKERKQKMMGRKTQEIKMK